ncbi:SIR2 family protein [Acidobacteria bacterium AH-259-G07]|nr:SIR2 family protein [Acidobacteria bacterium AH-259-G07]
MEDLIRRLAILRDQDPGDDPGKWYKETFEKQPVYSELIESLAPTRVERMSLLKSYFEPTKNEKEEGLKVPTPAHRSIARLVAAGYFRIIVTTNFDRLLEQALELEGLSPTTVSTPDHIAGMPPLPHVDCLVVKVNGDYLDTRIKNTPDELIKYDDATNALLDRIFEEYGLIVCGWSGEWDLALVDAIRRSTRFRFSTFWMNRGSLSQEAKELIKQRKAIRLKIESADAAFVELETKIAALENQRLKDPVSPRLAVATIKKYLSEDKYRIQLEDLVMSELGVVIEKTSDEAFPDGSAPSKESYLDRVERMEVVCQKIVPMIGAGVYWGDTAHDQLWKRCVEALARSEQRAGTSYRAWSYLKYYPATLLLYAAGIAAIARKRYGVLKTLIEDGVAKTDSDDVPIVLQLGSGQCLRYEDAQWLFELEKNQKRKTPGSDWMAERLPGMLLDILGPDIDFEDIFDEVEITLCMVAAAKDSFAPVGRFSWRGARQGGALVRMSREIKALNKNHPLLAAGMFRGDLQILEKSFQQVNQAAQQVALR